MKPMPVVEVVPVPVEGAAEALSAALEVLADAIAERLINRAREELGVAADSGLSDTGRLPVAGKLMS